MVDVRVEIVEGALGDAGGVTRQALGAEELGGIGAVVVFEGIVRGIEDGAAIEALEYEAYMPMAARQLDALAHEVVSEYALISMRVQHSTGRVPVGACSFRLTVAAAHRAEALAAMGAFIDRMKQDVPIWKTPVPV